MWVHLNVHGNILIINFNLLKIIFNLIFWYEVKPVIQKGAQWRKVASRGDGTSTAELVCRAEGIPNVHFIWEKNNILMDFNNPRLEIKQILCLL